MFACAVGGINSMDAAAEETMVYVASNGSDTGAGTSTSPYATLDKALSSVVDGGTITL